MIDVLDKTIECTVIYQFHKATESTSEIRT